jgi:cell wall assembly regulator SMI1
MGRNWPKPLAPVQPSRTKPAGPIPVDPTPIDRNEVASGNSIELMKLRLRTISPSVDSMFVNYFIEAQKNLCRLGFPATIKMGKSVSEDTLQRLDLQTDFPMPAELRRFYLELGDGFQFIPDETEQVYRVGWEPMRLSDHKLGNRGFYSQMEEGAMQELSGRHPRVGPDQLREEMEKRKKWMPFYGFTGGGDYLCLDLSVNPPPVRFYAAFTWMATPATWDFVLARSLTEFIQQWSRYNFLSPSGEWTSFCHELSGQFDWKPEHFKAAQP